MDSNFGRTYMLTVLIFKAEPLGNLQKTTFGALSQSEIFFKLVLKQIGFLAKPGFLRKEHAILIWDGSVAAISFSVLRGTYALKRLWFILKKNAVGG